MRGKLWSSAVSQTFFKNLWVLFPISATKMNIESIKAHLTILVKKKADVKRLKLAVSVGLKLTGKLKKFSLCRKISDSKSLSPLIKVSQTKP